MFTGLVQDIGTVVAVDDTGAGRRLRIAADVLGLAARKAGASICCSGCCLTATSISGREFTADVSAETLSKTVIGGWRAGDKINLEPSLAMGDELGGHFVFGHVDGLAEITAIEAEGDSRRLVIAPPPELMRFIAPKGSVALDGVSLTVNAVDEGRFGVTIIPHTWEHTVFQYKKPGDRMHIEADMLARYVARMIEVQP